MSDDHAAQAIGVYNSHLSDLDPTPVLDDLASGGITFMNCFVTNSICTPSRACILTGQYSHINGILDLEDQEDRSKHDTLGMEKQYLPIEMRKLGYETAMIGKWHLITEPNFDHYEVLPGQGRYNNPGFIKKSDKKYPEERTKYEGHSTDVITDLGIEWIKNRTSGKPFFLMHHYKSPHGPFRYAERYEDYLDGVKIPEPATLFNRDEWGSEATRGSNDSLVHSIGASVSPRHIYRNHVAEFGIDTTLAPDEQVRSAYQEYLQRYLRCIKGIDDNLGRLFDFLKDEGLWENTVIIYTGDQGMMLGAHDFIDKRWMYEESMRMPFILHDPRSDQKGIQTDLIINNTDFAPTILELAGGSVPEYMQGLSFEPEIFGEKPGKWRVGTYYRYWMHLEHLDVPAHFGIRTKDYKLILFYGRHYDDDLMGTKSMYWRDHTAMIRQTPVAWEFYDLKKDPLEMINRYNDPEYSAIISVMKEELKDLREELGDNDESFPELKKIIETNWNK
jgi:arylsulfatase A-like enzyme